MNKQVAIQNLKDLTRILDSMKVTHWITDGTLLGFHREGDILDHDLDTDIGVLMDDFSPLLIKRIVLAGFTIQRVYGEISNGLEIAFKRGNVKTDLFFYYHQGDDLVHSAWDEKEKGWNQIKYRYPKSIVLPVIKKSYKGLLWSVPNKPANFLTTKYGDYNEVVKVWDWRFGPLNHEKTDYYLNEDPQLAVSTNQRIRSYGSWNLQTAVTLLIKSFRRRDCLNNLMTSIRAKYPEIKIQIVDDSGEKLIADPSWGQNTRIHCMPFDSGLSACRNMGVTMIKTPFFILLDDDFEFTQDTDITKLLEIYIQSDIDILGGSIIENGRPMEYFGDLDIDFNLKTLTYKKVDFGEADPRRCDLILNFFVARTVDIRRYPWDNKLKLAEHTAFFYAIKGFLKVGYTNKVKILHKPVRTSDYLLFRNRGAKFFRRWMEKKGIDKVINFEGKEVAIA